MLAKLINYGIFTYKLLVTIYKSSLYLVTIYRLCLDNDDVIYKEPFNYSFQERLETIQYNVTLSITAAISGISKENHELGLESPHHRRWFRKLVYCTKYKNINVRVAYTNYYPKSANVIRQGSPVYFFSVLNTISLKIPFFHPQYLNEAT